MPFYMMINLDPKRAFAAIERDVDKLSSYGKEDFGTYLTGVEPWMYWRGPLTIMSIIAALVAPLEWMSVGIILGYLLYVLFKPREKLQQIQLTYKQALRAGIWDMLQSRMYCNSWAEVVEQDFTHTYNPGSMMEYIWNSHKAQLEESLGHEVNVFNSSTVGVYYLTGALKCIKAELQWVWQWEYLGTRYGNRKDIFAGVGYRKKYVDAMKEGWELVWSGFTNGSWRTRWHRWESRRVGRMSLLVLRKVMAISNIKRNILYRTFETWDSEKIFDEAKREKLYKKSIEGIHPGSVYRQRRLWKVWNPPSAGDHPTICGTPIPTIQLVPQKAVIAQLGMMERLLGWWPVRQAPAALSVKLYWRRCKWLVKDIAIQLLLIEAAVLVVCLLGGDLEESTTTPESSTSVLLGMVIWTVGLTVMAMWGGQSGLAPLVLLGDRFDSPVNLIRLTDQIPFTPLMLEGPGIFGFY